MTTNQERAEIADRAHEVTIDWIVEHVRRPAADAEARKAIEFLLAAASPGFDRGDLAVKLLAEESNSP